LEVMIATFVDCREEELVEEQHWQVVPADAVVHVKLLQASAMVHVT